MRAFLRTRLFRFACSSAVFALLATSVLSYPAAAVAAGGVTPSLGATPTPALTPQQLAERTALPPMAPPTAEDLAEAEDAAPKAAESSPTIVGEVIERRTETSKHYRLSDGTYRAALYAAPIHYRDVSGKWADIDPRVMPAGLDGYANERARLKTRFASELVSDGSVGLSGEGWSLKIAAPGMKRALKAPKNDTVTYLGAARDTSYEYRVLPDGLKETVVLHSASANPTVTVDVTLTGLEAVRGFDSTCAFRDPETGAYPLSVGGFYVFDSSEDASGEPAYCPDAHMVSEPTATGVRLTYVVPQEWLKDPARVFPVMVDPTYGPGYANNSSHNFAAYPSNCYWLEYLRAGYYAYTTTKKGMCRGYISFDMSPLQNKFIRSANLRTYTIDTAGDWVQLWKMTTGPGVGCTWNTQPGGDGLLALPGSTQGHVYWPIAPTVQSWIAGDVGADSPNYGLRLNIAEERRYLLRFGSSRNADANRRPALFADYVDPGPSGTDVVETGTNTAGPVALDNSQVVTATVRVLSAVPPPDPNAPSPRNEIRHVRMLGDYHKFAQAGGDTDLLRGHIWWFATDPGWANKRSLGTGNGWVAWDPADTTHGNQYITALLDRCSATQVTAADGRQGYDITFVYRPKSEYGFSANNTTSYSVGYNSAGSGGAAWTSNWNTMPAAFHVVPAPAAIDPAASSSSGLDWFVETDANGDGIADNRADAGTAGRGYVTLSWNAIEDVAGYRVYLSDGCAWRQVDTVAAGTTTWSSQGKAIYPSDTTIASTTWSPSQSPFGGATGTLNLRDDPTPLYAKTSGSALDAFPGYAFKVVPYADEVSTPESMCATWSVQLPKRTRYVNEPAADTEADLGQMAGASAAAVLDAVGEPAHLELSATDLSIGSWGPEAALTRTYRSNITSATLLAPGWRFGFEERVASDAGGAVWVDGSGSAIRFTRKPDGSYRTPRSVVATLTQDALGFGLELKGGVSKRFETSGRLFTETDRDGQTTMYAWSANAVTITAPNAQTITVTLSGGKAVEATYLGRHLHYATTTSGLTVTANPDTQQQCTTVYTHDPASKRLTGVSVVEKPEAVWGFDYLGSSPAVSRVRYPGYGSDDHRRADIATDTLDPMKATLTRFAQVEDVPDTPITTTYRWSAAGAVLSRSNPGTTTACWLYDHNAVGEQLYEQSPLGRKTSAMTDLRGNVVISKDEGNRMTTTVYDGADDPVAETDPRGATIYRTYVGGRLTVEEKTLDTSGRRSRTEYTYGDARGFLTQKRSKIDETTWATTDYSDFAPCGKPRTTIERGVKLSSSGNPQDLTTNATYDDYGTLLTETNALAKTVTDQTPDIAGRITESEDAAGVVTHSRYDRLGNVTETWKSHESTTTKLDWRVMTCDGESRVTLETVKDRAGATVATISHLYDTAGREVFSDNSSIGGANVMRYDAAGNMTKVWTEGSDLTKDASSQRSTTNADGQPTKDLQPGATDASDDTVYNLDGTVAQEKNADGSVRANTYNAAGDLAGESTKSDAGTSTTSYTTDKDGQTVSQTDPDGSVTTFAYDLMGRLVASGIAGQPVTSKTYNTLGWVLSETEFDGVTKSHTYDAAGRETIEVIGGQTTTRAFDDLGREYSRTNPDASVLSTVRDCFGRVERETHTGTSGSTVRDTTTRYDAAGRIASTTDAVSGLARAYAYQPTGEVTITETRPGGRTITSGVHASGLLTSITASIGGQTIDWSVTATDTAGRVTDAVSAAFPVEFGICYDQVGRPIRAGSAPGGVSYYATGTLGAAALPPYPSLDTTPGATYSYSPVTGKKTNDRFSFDLKRSDNTTYTYDATGRVVSVVNNAAATTYAYNAASGALTGYRRPGETTQTLSYDAATGRILAGGGRTFVHNATTGQRTSAVTTATGATTTYTWTGERLTSATFPGGNASFIYDAAGQRTRSVVTTGGVATTTDITYEGLRLLGTSATRGAASWSLDYLYDERGAVFAGVYASSDTTTVPFLMVTTDRGDVRELIDQSGAAFAHYAYDAYGRPTELIARGTSRVSTATAQAIATRQVLRYASYAWDEATSLYHLSQRYYDPQVAAFISRDPARADGEESAYQYCGGDPVGKTDPSGLWNSYVHYNRTRDWAVKLGYPYWLACSIASVNNSVDKSHHWLGNRHPVNMAYHMDLGFGLSQVLRAEARGDWYLLGEGLHTVQDYYTHRYIVWKRSKSTKTGWAVKSGHIDEWWKARPAARSNTQYVTMAFLARFKSKWEGSFKSWASWN